MRLLSYLPITMNILIH